VSPSRLSLDQQVEAIRTEGNRFWDAIASADLAGRVPSCPDWTVKDLAQHLTAVQVGWTDIVEHPADDPTEAFTTAAATRERASGTDELVALGREATTRMLEVFASADPRQRTWTWATQQDVAFVTRHQVQEAAIHRWDAQASAGANEDPIAPDVAADSIDEFLMLTRPAAAGGAPDLPGTVHLHCTDVDGEWFVHPDGRVEAIHAKGDVALRGSASDLLLALYRRIPVDDLDVIGDRDLARTFLGAQVG
jgi:uncharacterized protein (TIGR03083 family)